MALYKFTDTVQCMMAMMIKILDDRQRCEIRQWLKKGYLPPGRSKCPRTPLFSILCIFLEFPVSVLQNQVLERLSKPSSSFLSSPPSFLPLSPSVECCLLECVLSS